MHRLKVRFCDRSKKFAVKFTNQGDILENVMQKGCELLQILGTRLVAEDDGTLVADENDVMYYTFTIRKPVLLLEDGKTWFPASLHSFQEKHRALGKTKIIHGDRSRNSSIAMTVLEHLRSSAGHRQMAPLRPSVNYRSLFYQQSVI